MHVKNSSKECWLCLSKWVFVETSWNACHCVHTHALYIFLFHFMHQEFRV